MKKSGREEISGILTSGSAGNQDEPLLHSTSFDGSLTHWPNTIRGPGLGLGRGGGEVEGGVWPGTYVVSSDRQDLPLKAIHN